MSTNGLFMKLLICLTFSHVKEPKEKDACLTYKTTNFFKGCYEGQQLTSIKHIKASFSVNRMSKLLNSCKHLLMQQTLVQK